MTTLILRLEVETPDGQMLFQELELDQEIVDFSAASVLGLAYSKLKADLAAYVAKQPPLA